MRMSVEQYRAEVVARVAPLPVVDVALTEALGLVLADPLTARLAVPPFTNSAMDGYAVRHADLLAARDATLPVAFDIPAGAAPAALPAGHAARIMTGAMVPGGADTVVKVEHTDQQPGDHPLPSHVRIDVLPALGANVRRTGEDVVVGEEILPAGTLVEPSVISAAAAVGHGTLRCHRRPRVAILATGSELAAPGAPLAPGHIPNSNQPLLAGLVAQYGGEVVWQGDVADSPDALRTLLGELATRADLLISAGGISAGAFEVVRQTTEALGASFGHVAMQPGGPQGGGVLRLGEARLPLLALPGNPVSVFVSFHRFARPMLAKLRGLDPATAAASTSAEVGTGWHSPAGKVQHCPVVVRDGLLAPVASLGSASHLVASLALADGLAIVGPETTTVAAGDRLPFLSTKGPRP